MAASKTKKNGNGNKVIKPVNSVHIVIYSCPNCGEELEELKLCNECDSPMKVVQVIEKYGSEADEYLEKLKKEGSWGAGTVVPPKKKESGDGGISGDDLEELDIPITGLQEQEEEDDEPTGLGEIFPDEDDGEAAPASSSNGDLDFMEALEKLDEEEDVEDLHDLGPDGLPEL